VSLSVRRLTETLNIDDAKAATILDLMRTDASLTHPAVVAWAEQCYHDPRRNSDSHAECQMVAINAELEGYGVEAIEGRYIDHYHHNIQAAYVNMGDTYTPTILFDNERRMFRVTNWGDWVEQNQRRRGIR
jgi:hypothetical protein